MKEITLEHSREILKNMCFAVGMTEKDFENFDFSKDNWFWDYTWTEDEENKFIDWVADFLLKNRYFQTRKYRGVPENLYRAQKIVYNYGWKTV